MIIYGGGCNVCHLQNENNIESRKFGVYLDSIKIEITYCELKDYGVYSVPLHFGQGGNVSV